jgi:Arc/MetJ family transcription regulator
MGKTTVDIDDILIAQAMQATRLRTKREVIEEGLRELIRNRNRELLRQELGTFDLDLTLDRLRTLREEG